MKKISFIIAFFVPFFLFSQTNSILWKIEKDSVKSYLLGTVHLFGKSFITNDSIIYKSLLDSKVILEENLSNSDSIINLRGLNNNLKELSSDEYNSLNQLIKPRININKFTLKEILILADKNMNRLSCLDIETQKDTTYMEDFIRHYAKDYSVKIKGLESTEETLKIVNEYAFSNLNNKELTNLLKNYLKRFSRNEFLDHCAIINLYKNKEYNFDFEKENNSPIIKNRNLNWMKKIPDILDTYKNVFIAVGIDHLSFKEGLIPLLKAEGYKVTPVKLK
jgi:uncharacterized protein